ncbi:MULTISPECIES: hypothetical protein [Pseudobutyrivibrio]|uniref:Uncharacterized protein n=1 Tax=Pseudobutyrivibrio ruminis TaxID=46206 RepID=A0A2G3DTG7_9FIRM|nr:hypothetical protein [Pseudobutyrivibrio ruminis]PHU34165.1 hypothetical protein CSX01_11395 [Pseudobutyrivibrio ruminis]
MTDNIKRIVFSLVVNVVAFIVLVSQIRRIDVVGQFIFMLIPVAVSIIGTGVLGKILSDEGPLWRKALIPTVFNIVYIVGEFVLINMYGVTNVEEFATQHSSQYVTVSQNNSPLTSIIVFSLLSYLGHYYVLKLVSKKEIA